MKSYAIALCLIGIGASSARAQNELTSQCQTVGSSAAMVQQCRLGAAAIAETQEAVGLAFTGGNPLPGASSTLGIRLGAIPRLSAALRLSVARINTDGFRDYASDDGFTSYPRAVNVDVAVGVFSGLSVFPTVGGFGSIDLLGSFGKATLSGDDGFVDSPTSWSAGARVGILRESFTAPGIAVSAMYRSFGDIQQGEPGSNDQDVFFNSLNNSVLSLRGTVGKRLLMFGATAGVGYDKYSGDVNMSVRTAPGATTFGTVQADDYGESRTSFFGNLSWTMLILHIVGEFGVQRGEGNTHFGSLAIRLAL